MKKKIVIAALGAGLILVAGATPEAHADIVSDAATDHSGIVATCSVLGESFTGNPSADGPALIGVGVAIAQHYGLTIGQAGEVEALQVKAGCPELMPELLATARYILAHSNSTVV